MTKKVFIWILAIILFTTSVCGAILDGNNLYYSDDDADTSGAVAIDSSSFENNGTIVGATTGVSGILNEAYYYDGSEEYVDVSNVADYSSDQAGTFSVWINSSSATGAAAAVVSFSDLSGVGYMAMTVRGDNGNIQFHTTGGYTSELQDADYRDDTWHHFVWKTDGTTAEVWRDGTNVTSILSAPLDGTWVGDIANIDTFRWGCFEYNGGGACDYDFNGDLDETAYWNRSITSTEIATLYNAGSGFNPYSGGAPSTDVHFSIDNSWTGNLINNFSIDISWSNGTTTSHSTTNGSVDLIDITSGNINATYYGMVNYFNKSITETITANTSNNIGTDTYQAYLCFNATSKVDGAGITANNFTINDTTETSCFEIDAGTHNVQAQRTNWYSKNQSFTISALTNTTQTVVNMSYANLTIYAIDGTTNESLSGYDLTVGSTTYHSFLEYATTVTNHSLHLINDTYNVTISLPGYATTTAYANITVNGDTNYTFNLYRSNSVTITIRDEITNDIITENITVRWTNNATTWENTTSTGSLFIHNLTATNYTLLFYGANYSTRTYTITVGNLSTQFLTAYMISSTYSTIFTVKDQDTGDVMADVTFTMYKLVNSTWTTVESKSTDITGKVQVYYDPIGNYRFTLSKSDYEDLVFYLNPILFSTYDVFMVKSSLLNYSVDYDDISIIYSPQTFDNNENTTFNFLISSPDGLLTDYSIRLTYPGGTSTDSGVNAIGEQLTAWVNISGATRWDRVQLEYNYTTTLSGTRTFTQYLTIRTNATASENTWTANIDRTFGLGLFERILIVTIIVIFSVGIASMVGQPIPGMAIGLFLFGFMVKIGFIPIWSILPSMFIGFLFLVWKSGGY